jgi:hypothetical protein
MSDPHLVPVDFPTVFVPKTHLNFLRLESFNDRLADNDVVNLVIEAEDLPLDRLQIRLRTTPGMWTKGVESHAGGNIGGAAVKLEAKEGATTGRHTLLRSELLDVTLILAKAKFLGVYTWMYELPGGALAPLLGKRIIFDWMQD